MTAYYDEIERGKEGNDGGAHVEAHGGRRELSSSRVAEIDGVRRRPEEEERRRGARCSAPRLGLVGEEEAGDDGGLIWRGDEASGDGGVLRRAVDGRPEGKKRTGHAGGRRGGELGFLGGGLGSYRRGG